MKIKNLKVNLKKSIALMLIAGTVFSSSACSLEKKPDDLVYTIEYNGDDYELYYNDGEVVAVKQHDDIDLNDEKGKEFEESAKYEQLFNLIDEQTKGNIIDLKYDYDNNEFTYFLLDDTELLEAVKDVELENGKEYDYDNLEYRLDSDNVKGYYYEVLTGGRTKEFDPEYRFTYKIGSFVFDNNNNYPGKVLNENAFCVLSSKKYNGALEEANKINTASNKEVYIIKKSDNGNLIYIYYDAYNARKGGYASYIKLKYDYSFDGLKKHLNSIYLYIKANNNNGIWPKEVTGDHDAALLRPIGTWESVYDMDEYNIPFDEYLQQDINKKLTKVYKYFPFIEEISKQK